MRIASETNSALSRHQKFYQLRMSGMKLHLVRSDPLEQIDCLVKAIVLALDKSDHQLKITRLPH